MTDVDIANLALSYISGKPITALDTTTQQGRVCLKWFAATRDEVLAAHPWNFAAKRYRSAVTWTAITGVADNGSGLVRITSVGHGQATGNRVHTKDIGGVNSANGTWYVTVIDPDNYDLDDSTFSGTYTASTGSWLQAPLFGWGYQHALPSDCIRVNKVNGFDSNEEDSVPYEVEGGILLCDNETLELSYVYQHTTYADWPQFFINAFSFLLASNIAQELTGPSSKAMDLRKQYTGMIEQEAMRRDARQGKGKIIDPIYASRLVRSRRYWSAAKI